MRRLGIRPADVGIYTALTAAFCLVSAYQVRMSFETLHWQRHYDFFVPYSFVPFTDLIDDSDLLTTWEQGTSPFIRFHVHLRDEVLAVNGQPFYGLSAYLRQSRKNPNLILTIRSKDSRIHHVNLGVPHCTCGITGIMDGVTLWFIPTLFCIVLGFFTVFLRPRATLAWAFLGIMLSLSQLRIYSEAHAGFQMMATPMSWDGWSRVPAVAFRSLAQHLWPAMLLLASTHFYASRRTARLLALSLTVLIAISAALQAIVDVAWSEDFRNLTGLHQLMETYRGGAVICAIASIALVAWFVNRKLAMFILTLELSLGVMVFWPPPPAPTARLLIYADRSSSFFAMMPEIHNTPLLVVVLFTSGCILGAVVAAGRFLTRIEALSLFFCVPLVAVYATWV